MSELNTTTGTGDSADPSLETARQVQVLMDLAKSVDGARVHSDYSGRGMCGAQCYAMYLDARSDAREAIEGAAAQGIRGACTDSLGMGAVVYWPGLRADPTAQVSQAVQA